MKFENVKLSDIKSVTKSILDSYSAYRIFLLNAPMGGGKTTFIREFCEHLGVDEEVTSPTFAIANVYISRDQSEIYHFDFYRIEKPEDAFQIGFYEYLESGNYCFLEWPDIITPYIHDKYLIINISQLENPELRSVWVTE